MTTKTARIKHLEEASGAAAVGDREGGQVGVQAGEVEPGPLVAGVDAHSARVGGGQLADQGHGTA